MPKSATHKSLRAYASERGISHEAVRQAIKAGRLVKSIVYVKGEPKIGDEAMADKEWAANTDQSKPRNRITGDPKHRRKPGEPMKPMANDTGGDGNSGPSYQQSRAIREAYMARLAKLDFDEKSGKTVSADAVRVAIFNTARTARDMLTAIPDRVAPLVVGQTDEHEIHRILTDEVRRIAAEIGKMRLPDAET